MKIKTLKLKDLRWLVEQNELCFDGHGLTVQTLINYLAKPEVKAYKICDKEGNPRAVRIGWIKPNPENKKELAISGITLLTQKEYQGKGYAKKLLKYFFKVARKNKINVLRSRIETTNAPCIKVHEQLGYELYETALDWYGKGRNCLIYVKNLKQ